MSGVDPAAQLVLRGALSIVFGWAAADKLRDVEAFRAAIDGYELLPVPWAVPAGAFLIAIEVGIAAGFWLPRTAPLAGAAAAALLLLYAAAIAVNLLRGRRDIDCGCGGAAGRRPISRGLVFRNVMLAAAALLGAAPTSERGLSWIDAVTIGASVPALVLLYAAADGLLGLRRHGLRAGDGLPGSTRVEGGATAPPAGEM